MKFLILFLISFSSLASYLPESKVGKDTNGIKIFLKKEKCEVEYSESCIKVISNESYMEVVSETQMKEDVESCADEDECQSQVANKECSSPQGSPVYTLDPNESYCTWLRPRQVMENASLKSAYEAQKAQENSKKAILEQIKLARSCGEKVINEMLYRNNVLKSLSKGQKKQLLQSYAEIKGLLEVGNLEQAKDDMLATNVDGVLVTSDDKTALVSIIDECLGL